MLFLVAEDLGLGVQELFAQLCVLLAVPEYVLRGGADAARLALVGLDDARGLEAIGSTYASRDNCLDRGCVLGVAVVDVQRLALLDRVVKVGPRCTDVDEGVRANHVLAVPVRLGRGGALLQTGKDGVLDAVPDDHVEEGAVGGEDAGGSAVGRREREPVVSSADLYSQGPACI